MPYSLPPPRTPLTGPPIGMRGGPVRGRPPIINIPSNLPVPYQGGLPVGTAPMQGFGPGASFGQRGPINVPPGGFGQAAPRMLPAPAPLSPFDNEVLERAQRARAGAGVQGPPRPVGNMPPPAAATPSPSPAPQAAAQPKAAPRTPMPPRSPVTWGGALRNVGRTALGLGRMVSGPVGVAATAGLTPGVASATSFIPPGEQAPDPFDGFAFDAPGGVPPTAQGTPIEPRGLFGNREPLTPPVGAATSPAPIASDPFTFSAGGGYVPGSEFPRGGPRFFGQEVPERPTLPTKQMTAQPSTQFPGAWGTDVSGVGVRPGTGGAPEFFNQARAGAPMREGEIGVIPPGYIGLTPQGREAIRSLPGAMRAAAERGDFSSLERIGAIDRRPGGPRPGVGGGGGNPAVMREAEKLMKEARKMQGRTARTAFERAQNVGQARLLQEQAESLLGLTTSQADRDAQMQRAQLTGDTQLQAEMMRQQGGLAQAAARAGTPDPFDPTDLGFKWQEGMPGQEGFFTNEAGVRATADQTMLAHNLMRQQGGGSAQEFQDILSLLTAGYAPEQILGMGQ